VSFIRDGLIMSALFSFLVVTALLAAGVYLGVLRW